MRLILDYVLDEVIGAGTETVVYRARQLPSGRSVAIKVAADHLLGSARADVDARLRGEARQLERLDHPAIVPLVEFVDGGLDPGAGGAPVALVYALAEDGTVADLVDRAGSSGQHAVGASTLTSEILAQWRADLVGALAAAHAGGFVHGDLSTSALLLSGDRIWLSGFGSAAAATATPDDDLTVLDQLLVGLAPPDREAPRSTPPRLLPRPPAPDRDRRPVVVGGAAIAAVALLAGIAALWLTARGSPRSAAPASASASAVTTMAGSDTVPAKPPCPGTGSAIPAGAVAVVGDPTG
ncbi:MAG TPA: protein kinase, partial [Acidimicrobiales bacterium]